MRARWALLLPALALAIPLPVAAAQAAALPNRLTDVERAAGWVLLFDGVSFRGWHGLGFPDVPAGHWAIEDGSITRVAKTDPTPSIAEVDLASDKTYADFELSWEWRVALAGNSGLKYNVSEQLSAQLAPAHSAKGWEYQMNDDERNDDNKLASHRSGALYDIVEPAASKRVNPAGEWNRSSIVFRGSHGEHWLNGQKILEFDLGTASFDSAFAASKYRSYPAWFGARRAGQIVLQDHGDRVWFRSIKIREIGGGRSGANR